MEIDDKDTYNAYWYYGGIASAIACCFTHPMDLVRVNMQSQVHHFSAWQVTKLIVKYRGVFGLYHGLVPSVQRQLTYAVTRFGIYETAKNHGLVNTFSRKVEVAGMSGLIAGYINAPFVKVSIHIRTDAVRPVGSRRDYMNMRDGLTRLYAEGGMDNLFSGAKASAFRGMFITIGQLSVYDQIKQKLLEKDTRFADNWETFFFASLFAGGFATVITTPIEVVKVMSMEADKERYRGMIDMIKYILERRGFRGFFQGMWPSLFRTVPQTTLTFLIYEELRLKFGK